MKKMGLPTMFINFYDDLGPKVCVVFSEPLLLLLFLLLLSLLLRKLKRTEVPGESLSISRGNQEEEGMARMESVIEREPKTICFAKVRRKKRRTWCLPAQVCGVLCLIRLLGHSPI